MNTDAKSLDTIERKWLWRFFWIAVVVIVLQVVGYLGIQCWQGDDRGTFGDMFGAVNTLFSGLALAALVVTMLMQRDELKMQYKELVESRKEFEKTVAAQEGMLHLAEEEKKSREARESRAATLMLSNWEKHDRTQREGGESRLPAWRFSATNLGQVVTNPSVRGEDQTRLGKIDLNPCLILPSGGVLTLVFVQLDEQTTWAEKEDYPTARFWLEYVDATGSKRQQTYELKKAGGVHCTDLGIDA